MQVRLSLRNDSVFYCPYCRSEAKPCSKLTICSNCTAFYHRECWKENKGCSVYGCTGTNCSMNRAATLRRTEPKWLIALRIIVFGFIPGSMAGLSFVPSTPEILFLLGWGIVFVLCAPFLFIVEVVGLFEVLKHPELTPDSGHWLYHIISLLAYGAIVFAAFYIFS
jgi:hypothetical protein